MREPNVPVLRAITESREQLRQHEEQFPVRPAGESLERGAGPLA